MSWQTKTAMMSPKEERQFWLDTIKRRSENGGNGLAVNCRHMPSLDRTPVLRKIIEDGLVVRVRLNRQWNKTYRQSRSKLTLLRLV